MAQTSAFLTKALAYKEEGDLEQAERECRAALRHAPDDAGAHHLLGLLALNAQRVPEALQSFEAAVKAAPDHADYLIDLALIYEGAGRTADAWPLFQKATRIAPRSPKVLGASVGFLARLGKSEGLMPLYREAVSVGWRDPAIAVNLGNALYRSFQYAEADEVFRDALAAEPRNKEALMGHGMVLGGLKRFAEAVKCLEAGLVLDPGQPLLKAHLWARAHLQAALGGIALSDGRWSEATARLSESIEFQRQVLAQTVPAPVLAVDTDQRRVHRLLYIEIELLAREFEARVLLAIHAAAKGLDVILGQKMVLSQIGYHRLPAGAVLIKTMNGNDVGRIKNAAKTGHRVVVLDEEAFGGSGKRPLWVRLNTDPEAIARTDVIIAQGEEYLALLSSVFPDAAAKTLVLGNPRVDLYRPAFRKPRAAAGARRQILICSQSQVSNPRGLAFPDLVHLHLRGIPMAEPIGRESVEGTKEVFAFEISIIAQLQEATRAVAAAYPETPVLFRPHPAEDPKIWEKAFAGLANVTVSSAGSMGDALSEARAMVYVRGCATGLEAHFQEVPIVRFDGDGRVPEPGDWISSNIGFPAKSPDDVVAALGKIDAGESTQTNDRSIVARSFHSDGDRLVCVGVAQGLADAIAPHLLADPSAREKLRALAGFKTQQREFDTHKFPATSVDDVRALAARLARVAGLPPPRIEAFAHNVFHFLGHDAEA